MGGESKFTEKDTDINYIIWPKEKEIEKDSDNWTTEQNIINNKYKYEEAQIGKLKIDRFKNEENYANEIDSDDDKEEEIITTKKEKIKVINDEADFEKIKIMEIDDNTFANIYKENDEEDEINTEETHNKKESENKIRIGKKTDNLISVPVNINEIIKDKDELSEYDEETGKKIKKYINNKGKIQ